MTSRDLFRTTLDDLAAKAKATLPDSPGRIDSAVKLVLSNDVELHADGTATVGSRTNPAKVYSGVNGTCSCVDFPRAPEGFCAHRIARALQLRTDRAMRALLDAEASRTTLEGYTDVEKTAKGKNASAETSATPDANLTVPEALKPHIVFLHGKPFVQYAGLLALAHERGLVSLKASFISVTAELALAEAEATFADGKTFAECADATPSNVGPKVKAHYARMALTRAKARTLRDALNVGICTLEELTEE